MKLQINQSTNHQQKYLNLHLKGIVYSYVPAECKDLSTNFTLIQLKVSRASSKNTNLQFFIQILKFYKNQTMKSHKIIKANSLSSKSHKKSWRIYNYNNLNLPNPLCSSTIANIEARSQLHIKHNQQRKLLNLLKTHLKQLVIDTYLR